MIDGNGPPREILTSIISLVPFLTRESIFRICSRIIKRPSAFIFGHDEYAQSISMREPNRDRASVGDSLGC
jgi:hypothetical protein